MKTFLSKKLKYPISILFILLFLSACQIAPWSKKANAPKKSDLLFVIHSGAGLFEIDPTNSNQPKLVLNQVNNSVSFFNDGDKQSAGTQPIAEFVTHWNLGKNSFSKNPPKASFVYYRTASSNDQSTSSSKEINLVLMDPDYNSSIDQLTFKIKVSEPTEMLPVGQLLETSVFITEANSND